MKNPRISKREQSLIKGALRRVFGRSDLRQSIIKKNILTGYHDPKRKRVKFWVKCEECGGWEAKSNVQVDHIEPIIPIDKSFEEMTLDDVVNRLWCEESMLQLLCKPCHKMKTKAENKERRRLKVEKT